MASIGKKVLSPLTLSHLDFSLFLLFSEPCSFILLTPKRHSKGKPYLYLWFLNLETFFYFILDLVVFLQALFDTDLTYLFAFAFPWCCLLFDFALSLSLLIFRVGWVGSEYSEPGEHLEPSLLNKPELRQSKVWGMMKCKTGALEVPQWPWVNHFSFSDFWTFLGVKWI